MAEYVGNEALAAQISDFKSEAEAIAFLLDNLIGGLNEAGHGYAPEYATWHADELLENAQLRATELARRLESVRKYTITRA